MLPVLLRQSNSRIRGLSILLMRYLTALLLIFATLGPAQSEDGCGDVCVDAVEGEEGIELYLVNPYPYPVTASLYARTRNLRAHGGNPVTVTLGGNSRKRALLLNRRDRDGPYDYRYWYDWTFGRQDADHDDSLVYRPPWRAGERFRVMQGFNGRFSHNGRERYAVDFDMPVGTPVHAARGGTVVDLEVSHDEGGWDDKYYETANYIVILHDDGTTGEYYHLKHRGAAVEAGDRVRAGDRIGRSGNTGHTTTPHLHFAVYRADTWGRTQSVPFLLGTDRGIVKEPKQWQRYGISESGSSTADASGSE
jgi:murein DD-endopeptidase MepM/ murein hydrolase activator NlpD